MYLINRILIFIARKLREISTDYRIGFGSFVDKETDPFEFQNFFKYV